MLSKLETRLDVIIYRLNFFKSIDTVKQFINHKNVSVNNKLVNKCSYEVNFYDIVSIKKKHHKKLLLSLWYNLKFKYTYINYPKYMEVNYDILSCLIFRHPKLKEIPYPFYINTTKNGIKSLLYNSK